MNLGKKVIAGVIALAIGLSFAFPTLARADWDDWHHRDHHEYRWWHHDHDRDWRDRDWDHDYDRDRGNGYYPEYRAYPYSGYRTYPYAYRRYRRGYIAPNGQGMIDPRNPNFVWACDAGGHHCHWARRFY